MTPHLGNTLSCMQVQAMVRAAERQTGVRPRRRIELLRQRIAGEQARLTKLEKPTNQKVIAAQTALTEVETQPED